MIFFDLTFIIFAISIIVMLYVLYFPKDNDDWLAHFAITCFVVGVILFICCAIDIETNPTAMDVYRGKATIAITYEDGVPVDSTVVFKKKR